MLLPPANAADARFVPAQRSFQVIAIVTPVPPYTGYPLDPPFRSRFQARFLDSTSALLMFPNSSQNSLPLSSAALWNILRDLMLAMQYVSEARHVLDSIAAQRFCRRRWSSCPCYLQPSLPYPRLHLGFLPCQRVLWGDF